MNEGMIAAISAAVGAVLLEIIKRVFARNDRSLDEATSIRKELREEVVILKREIDELRADLDGWKEKYYALLEKHNQVLVEHKALLDQHRELKSNYQALLRQVMELKRLSDLRSLEDGGEVRENGGEVG